MGRSEQLLPKSTVLAGFLRRSCFHRRTGSGLVDVVSVWLPVAARFCFFTILVGSRSADDRQIGHSPTSTRRIAAIRACNRHFRSGLGVCSANVPRAGWLRHKPPTMAAQALVAGPSMAASSPYEFGLAAKSHSHAGVDCPREHVGRIRCKLLQAREALAACTAFNLANALPPAKGTGP